jgi:hypothetical protein
VFILVTTNFNLDEYARAEVEQKLRSLLETCQIYHAPMFACVAVSNNEEQTEYANQTYTAQAHCMGLKNDIVRRCVLIADGFEAVPPREAVFMDCPEGVVVDE